MDKYVEKGFCERYGELRCCHPDDGKILFEHIKDDYEPEVLKTGVGTSNGFDYDVLSGGYIDPFEILKNKERAQKIQDAINLLLAWQSELEDHNILNEF